MKQGLNVYTDDGLLHKIRGLGDVPNKLTKIVRIEFLTDAANTSVGFALDTLSIFSLDAHQMPAGLAGAAGDFYGGSSIESDSGALILRINILLPGLRTTIDADQRAKVKSKPLPVSATWVVNWSGDDLTIAADHVLAPTKLNIFLSDGRTLPSDVINTELVDLTETFSAVGLRLTATPLVAASTAALGLRQVGDANGSRWLVSWSLYCDVGIGGDGSITHPSLAAIGPWPQPFYVAMWAKTGLLFTVLQSVEHTAPSSTLLASQVTQKTAAPYLVELLNVLPDFDKALTPTSIVSLPFAPFDPTARAGATRVVNGLMQGPLDRALRLSRRGHGLSFVPRLSGTTAGGGSGFARVRYALHLTLDPTRPLYDAGFAPTMPGQFTSVDLTGTYVLDFEHVRTLQANPARATAAVSRESESKFGGDWLKVIDAYRSNPYWSFTFLLDSAAWQQPGNATANDPSVVRMGALDLLLDTTGGGVSGKGHWYVRSGGVFVLDGNGRCNSADASSGTRAPQLNLLLDGMPLLDLLPGASDPVPDERISPISGTGNDDSNGRVQPVLISHRDPAPTPLLLQVDEQIDAVRSRGLNIKVMRAPRAISNGPRKVTVIDTQPFTIGRISYDPLDVPEDVEEIANWRESELEGSKWNVAAPLSGFALEMPPQTVGEDAEKGGLLGLSDTVPLGFRFGSTAQFRLSTSYFQQRYSEPAWNTRRVLGYPGQRSPGAGILDLRVELLYGMTTRIDAASLPTQLRLAEIFSRLGSSPSGVGDDAIARWGTVKLPASMGRSPPLLVDEKRTAWNGTLVLLENRLGVFEAWSEGDQMTAASAGDTHISSVPLHLEDGVSHYLRKTADLAYPIHESRQIAPDSGAQPPSSLPPHSPDGSGLKGGAVWGFESDRIYQEVLRDRHSSSGLIERPYFSALGGWGYQRAAFAKDKSKIYSDTAMGRVSYYAVERIGRIGVFWNRAKLVTIYQRSVLPSLQFVGKQASWHVGVPVLRKVEEYVEFLQPERTYPESGTATLPNGCVEAFEAVTKKIPVDSASWGRDLADGWEIPLWNPDEDPSIYPRPTLRVRLAGDKQSTDSIFQTIAEPQRLFFYTSTRAEDDANTDAWLPVSDVDFTTAAAPAPDTLATINAGDPDGLMPDAAIDEPGYWRFTFPLERGGGRANLVDGRVPALLAVSLDSVTMTRSTGRTGPAAPPNDAGRLLALTRELASHRQSLVDAVARIARAGTAAGDAAATIKARAKDAVARIAAAETSVKDSIATLKQKVTFPVRPSLSNPMNALSVQVKAIAQRTLDSWRDILVSAIDDEAAVLLRKISNATPATVVPVIQSAIADWNSATATRFDIDVLFADPKKAVADAQVAVKSGTTSASKAIGDFDRWWNAPVLGDALDKATSMKASIDEAMQSVSDGLPTPTPTALVPVIAALNRVLEQIRNANNDGFLSFRDAAKGASATLAQLQAAWATWKGSVAGTIATTCANALDSVAQALSPLETAALGTPLKVYLVPGTSSASSTVSVDLTKSATFVSDALAWAAILPTVGDIKAIARQRVENVRSCLEAGIRQQHDAVARTLMGVIDGAFVAGGPFVPVHALDQWLKDLVSASPLPDLGRQVDDWLDSANDFGSAAVDSLKSSVAGAMSSLSDFSNQLEQTWQLDKTIPTLRDAGTTLALLRAAGDGPLLPELGFNRERIAYFFDDNAAIVRSSPVAALVNRVGDDLKSFGIRIPTQGFLDRVLPASLQNFDISTIFPDFAGLKNSGLFDGSFLPDLSNDNVKVTHGVDKEHQQGWLKADVDVDIPGANEVFSFGPLALTLVDAEFIAHAEVTAGVNGQVSTVSEADLNGDWKLAFGGASLVTFASTSLHYDRTGHLNFDIDADNIQLDPSLEWIGAAIRTFSDPGKPLDIELVMDGAMPVGVRAFLDLPLPPLGEVAVCLTGLTLSAVFELLLRNDVFSIGIGFDLGRKTNPFTLMIYFLGGGGYIESMATYTPSTGKVATTVSIGITAGAGTGFNVGVANGTVRMLIGLFIEYNSDGASRGLSVGVMILVVGNCVLLGFIGIDLVLLLELVYSPNGNLKGTGLLEVTVELCVFKKISVREQVAYVFSQGSGSANSDNAATKRMKRYA